MKQHGVGTVCLAHLHASFANVVSKQLAGSRTGRKDQNCAIHCFRFRSSCAGFRRGSRRGMREPQNMRLMMSTVRELVHDVLDLRAEGETEGERREIPEATLPNIRPRKP
jgi:hypothetical protein